MIIGVDFDNTIVCYDSVFYHAALEKGLIPSTLPATKNSVRDHLRAVGREAAWTELQGEIYGTRMHEAEMFPGVREFFTSCHQYGVPVKIISHKSQFPYAGPPYDLHRAAYDWLRSQDGFVADEVCFELTKEAKLARIAANGCTHFIDDLPEFLAEPDFPGGVEKILFDPNGSQTAACSWDKINRLIFPLAPLPSGANNRVSQVNISKRRLLRKEYFQHPQDPRDRLRAEFSFCRFAWNCGVHVVPEPIVCDISENVGIYEFIEGRSLRPEELAADHVQQAMDFFHAINAHKHRTEAQTLPSASEACFSLSEHMDCVARRVARLKDVTEDDAAMFIRQELIPAWERVRDKVARATLVDEVTRCISPSDFGFHNALLTTEGRLRFIDFEYAGWDDPAKVACDFFCQPAVPVPIRYYPEVVDAIAPKQQERVALLLPVYRIKWCCILLNEFLPDGNARRTFSGAPDRKTIQLAKARTMLERVFHGEP